MPRIPSEDDDYRSIPYTTVRPTDLKMDVKPAKPVKAKVKRDVYVYDRPFFLSLILKVSVRIVPL